MQQIKQHRKQATNEGKKWTSFIYNIYREIHRLSSQVQRLAIRWMLGIPFPVGLEISLFPIISIVTLSSLDLPLSEWCGHFVLVKVAETWS